jgi:hypothetical protein
VELLRHQFDIDLLVNAYSQWQLDLAALIRDALQRVSGRPGGVRAAAARVPLTGRWMP